MKKVTVANPQQPATLKRPASRGSFCFSPFIGLAHQRSLTVNRKQLTAPAQAVPAEPHSASQ
jgi:hypothetical protein